MTPQEKFTYNQHCAEFLGYCNPVSDKDFHFIYKKEIDERSCIPPMLELNYENRFLNDWNWIMEVSVKIINTPNGDPLGTGIGTSTKKILVQNALRSAKKEAVVQAINEFLIWYKENNK